MKTFRTHLLFLFCLTALTSSTALAQSIANYATSRTTGITYNSIAATGNAFSSWRNNGSYSQDDNRSYQTDIGFDFWYNGTRYTKFSVSTNGFIDFSSSAADGGASTGAYGYDNAAFTGNGSGTWLAIAPFYDDMTAQGGVDALGNSIKYLVTGDAPNRVLTVEWINMAVYSNTTPSLNFQVKLYETTGVIEFLYGLMDKGNFTFSYSVGINAATLSNTATATQLKMQQTENTNTFNNTEKNNLSAMPATNSKITWTPPSPAGTLNTNVTFSAVTASGMTVAWTNWCSNEVGYALYYSTDNIDFTFLVQKAANATSHAATGLSPATTYYWRVYAVTDGAMSGAASGSRVTGNPGTRTSKATGNWNTNSTWTGNTVPVATDNTTIISGNTVTLTSSTACNDLTISGNLVLGNASSGATTLTVNGNLVINNGASISVSSTAATHNLVVYGNIINNGSINLAPTGSRVCNVTFRKDGNASISGTGATNTYNLINLNMGTSADNILEMTATNFSAAADFLTLTNGTFKLSGTNTFNLTPYTGLATIPSSAGFIMNNANATANFNGGIYLSGNLANNNGTLNIGNAADRNIESNGGNVLITGGTTRVAGRYFSTNPNILSNFTIEGGSFVLPVSGSTSTTVPPFQINAPGSVFNMDGGSIIIEREGGSGAQDLGFEVTAATFYMIDGGTLQIGNANTPASQTMTINSVVPLQNLAVSSANATARVINNPLTIQVDVNVNSGTLNMNDLDMYVGGNWTDAGTLVPGTSTVIFNGKNDQLISDPNGEIFNHMQTDKESGQVVMMNSLTLNGNLSLTRGNLSINNNTLSINGAISGDAKLVGSANAALVINGSGALGTLDFDNSTTLAKTLKDFTLNRSGSGSATLLGTDSLLINGTLTLSNGTLNTADKLVLLSTAASTARVAPITNGALSGDVIVQRYIPGGAGKRRWRLLSAPVNVGGSINIQQLQDNIHITGTGGTANGFDDSPNNVYSLKTYDETIPGSSSNGWAYPPTTNFNVNKGMGMCVFIRGDRNTPEPFNQFATPNNATLDYKGTLNSGTITLPLSYTNSSSGGDGYNLIGNPYASAIDWQAASGWTKTRIQNKIWIYNPATGSYGTYDASLQTGTNGCTRYIASGQGFFVKATAANPSISFTENVKVSNAPSNFFRNAATPNLFRMTLVKDSLNSDEALFYLDNSVKKDDSDESDAAKFFNDDMNFYSKASNGRNLAINAWPLPLGSDTIALSVFSFDGTDRATGMYSFRLTEMETLDDTLEVYLLDTYRGQTINLKQNNTYSFEINNDALSAGNDRFKLVFKGNYMPLGIDPQENRFAVYPNPFNNELFITLPGYLENEPAEIRIYNTLGQLVSSHTAPAGSTVRHLQPGTGMSTGLYIIQVNAGSYRQITRLMKQ
jgi:hypothetical protein